MEVDWKCDQKAYELHMECHKKFEFEFCQKYLSTPWCSAVDQDWRSKLHALKHARKQPGRSMLALLSMPSWSGKGAPLPSAINLCSRHLLDCIEIVQRGGGYTTTEGWTGLSG